MTWPDRRAAERLIDGADADTPLGRLLAHARGPAAPHELLGEQQAAAMFRAGGGAPGSVRKRRTLSRVLAVKVAVVGALLTGSGLAVASATGTLPLPVRDTPRPAPAVPPRPVDAPTGARQQPSPGPPTAPPAIGKSKGPNEHARSPHPRGNTAHPTPGRKNGKSPNPGGNGR
ncbi:hypothetical protein SAMN05421812_117169 [Asanoa hainanensis]|uniref:Uncharacterized protein n=1 Tax=Asanoa hainanensis TaxID=560556 RepID=A0A239PC12_9ACTN|nr:hypothetical protein [Asanoa hainanensis]SNT64656.1 hypothetical protein SAMN05421812_117169 [Asanoa hainanensis]